MSSAARDGSGPVSCGNLPGDSCGGVVEELAVAHEDRDEAQLYSLIFMLENELSEAETEHGDAPCVLRYGTSDPHGVGDLDAARQPLRAPVRLGTREGATASELEMRAFLSSLRWRLRSEKNLERKAFTFWTTR